MNTDIKENPSPAGLSDKRWTASSNGLWHAYDGGLTREATVYQPSNSKKWCLVSHKTEYDTLEEAKAVAEALVAMKGGVR